MSPRDRLAQLRELRDRIQREINHIERTGGARASNDDSDVQALIAQCAAAYGVTVELLMSRNREPMVVRARQEAYWHLRQRELSYPAIGRIFDRDHSTIMAGVRRVDRRRGTRAA